MAGPNLSRYLGTTTVKSAGRQSGTVTIANGQSLSGALDLGGATLAGIVMPSGWTAAALTFQVSADGVTYQDLVVFDEYTIASSLVAASKTIGIPAGDFAAWRYVKVRSGTSGTPVNQGGSRVLTLVSVL